MVSFGLFRFFDGLFNVKAIHGEERLFYLTHSDGYNGVHAFLKDISLKVNTIAWLEFELAYYDVAVRHISHNITETHAEQIDR